MNEQLYALAKTAMDQAYAPYSGFSVGAALLAESGKLYSGCNIENAAYPVTCCAERVAIFQAVSAGERDFKELLVVANTEGPVAPCGSCRQVMSEFFSKETLIHLTNREGCSQTVTMRDLLPYSFGPDDLQAKSE